MKFVGTPLHVIHSDPQPRVMYCWDAQQTSCATAQKTYCSFSILFPGWMMFSLMLENRNIQKSPRGVELWEMVIPVLLTHPPWPSWLNGAVVGLIGSWRVEPVFQSFSSSGLDLMRWSLAGRTPCRLWFCADGQIRHLQKYQLLQKQQQHPYVNNKKLRNSENCFYLKSCCAWTGSCIGLSWIIYFSHVRTIISSFARLLIFYSVSASYWDSGNDCIISVYNKLFEDNNLSIV